MAKFLLLLSKDAALSSALPFTAHTLLQELCNALTCDLSVEPLLEKLKTSCPELVALFIACQEEGQHGFQLIEFVLHLVLYIEKIHQNNLPPPDPCPLPGSYNPSNGVAYYFTDHGCQVRKQGGYNISGKEAARNIDDIMDDPCSKSFPLVSRGGYGYMFLWFCPLHGHSYGLHLIKGGEGRKDPFSSLFKYITEAPTHIFYDFACALSEYCLNREPEFFKQTRFWHDIFHSFPHKCGPNFRSVRVQGLEGVNSEICEQWNGFLQCIKFTASHLSQEHMMFFIQFMICLQNKRKTDLFSQQASIALQGME